MDDRHIKAIMSRLTLHETNVDVQSKSSISKDG